MAGLNQEVWTDVLVEDFNATEEAAFLNEIPDESRFVMAGRNENEVINLVDVGVDPEVIINGNTYPIGIVAQTDSNIPISLDGYKTKATPVSDDEINFIAYDKIRLVQKKHKNAVMRVKHTKALHALAPNSDTTDTPVLVTTGDDDGTGRKMLTLRDLITLKQSFDDAKIPVVGRVLVLCSQHQNDLLVDGLNKGTFKGRFSNEGSGALNGLLYGFKTFMFVDSPYFAADKTKKAFASVPVSGDQMASVAFYAPDMFRASGLTKNYTDEPTTQTQQWLYNIRHNYIVLPRKQRGIAAIVSAAVA